MDQTPNDPSPPAAWEPAAPLVSSSPPDPEPRGRRRIVAAIAAAALMGSALGAGGTFAFLAGRDRTVDRARVAAPSVVTRLPGDAREAAAAAAKKVLPSIVRIDTVSRGGRSGTGSGVAYRKDGYIVTNDHVVRGARELEVRFSDGDTLPARVIGSAAPTVDVAVVKVDGRRLVEADFGDTGELHPGDLAVAVGNPLGFDTTVTAGVVSALHRNGVLGGELVLTDAIQTDAPLNPGNSGGPLVNAAGEVIGINTASLGERGGTNVGFAIPAELVRKVADQIIAGGRAELAFLGISGEDAPDGGGVEVREAIGGGPAEDAGLQAGDVIRSVDGADVASMAELVALLIGRKVGQQVRVDYDRGGLRMSATATLASRPGLTG